MTTSAENKVSDRRRARYPRCTHVVNTHRVHLLTCAEYDDLLAMAQGCCMLCERSDAPLCVDHDHELGPWAVRGLLCRSCNSSLRCVDSGTKEATVSVAEYLAAAWHLHQPGSALKQARMRPRAECARCGRNVAVRPDGRPWRHWSRLPGEVFEILCTGTLLRPVPAIASLAPEVVRRYPPLMDAGNAAWAHTEAKRRGQPFGDFMDGLIAAERDRVASRPPALVAASQEQPKTTRSHAQTCKCGTCHPKEGKR